MSNILYPLLYGPTGNALVVDASGRLVTNGDSGADAYILGYGQTGRALVVDASGRLLTSALSTGGGSSGEVNTASNLAGGSGTIFATKSGTDLRFRSLLAGSGIYITTSGNVVRIDNTQYDDLTVIESRVNTLETDFANASGVWTADISSTNAVANGVRIDFDNASGVWSGNISTIVGGSGIQATTVGSTVTLDSKTVFIAGSGITVEVAGDEVTIRRDSTRRLTVETSALETVNLTSVSDIYVSNHGAYTLVQLPVVDAAMHGRTITIKDGTGNASTYNIGVNTQGAELIDSSGTYLMTHDYQCLSMVYNHNLTKWCVISNEIPETITIAQSTRTDFDNASGVWLKPNTDVVLSSGQFTTGIEVVGNLIANTLRTPEVVLVGSGNVSVDLEDGSTFYHNSTGPVTYSFSNPIPNVRYTWILQPRDVNCTEEFARFNFPVGVLWANAGSGTVAPASGTQAIVSMLYRQATNKYYADVSTGFQA